jgi:hypothetical protein
MNEKYRLDWEDIKKAFYLKYYPPIEAYSGRYHIYNFWPHPPHPVKSITQAWGRLNERLHKNPCHGLSTGIILIIFYVRIPAFSK